MANVRIRLLRFLRRKRYAIGFAFKKPIGVLDVRDRIAYQALWTSRLSAFLSLLAVLLSATVAIVAIRSLNLNIEGAEQSRNSSAAQGAASKILADAAARQAEASISAALTSRNNLIASQRAWVGPSDATLTEPVVGTPLKAIVSYTNTGREPALTTASLTPKIFSLDDWNNGRADEDINRAKAECLKQPMEDRIARVTFPTSGFNAFQISYDGTQTSLRDVSKISVTAELVSGKSIATFNGCFVYRTVNEVHRTSFCYFYQAKVSNVAHLNYCAGGQAVD